MSFLRMRRHAKRPTTLITEGEPDREVMVPVTVNGRTFASVRAAKEYAQREYLADIATRFYLETDGMRVIDGTEHRVKFGPKRNAKTRLAVRVTNKHARGLPSNVPEGFENAHYERHYGGGTVQTVVPDPETVTWVKHKGNVWVRQATEGIVHTADRPDVMRRVPSTTMNDRRWMGGTGKRQGNPFWSGDVDRKLRKAVK